MTRVKVCGLTREEDVRAAVALGAAYVGFNFASGSPRRLTLSRARRLAAGAAGAVRVGVFVDEPRAAIVAAADAGCLDLLQIHRPLRAEDLELPLPIIAVVTTPDAAPVSNRCHGVLFDSQDPRRDGPARIPLDWRAMKSSPNGPAVLLAGGLTPENVGAAIRLVRPSAVDVASGIESAPGIKDQRQMRQFFEAVRRADAAL